MKQRRTSAILCHITSLPGPGGLGDLGEGAHQLLRWLHQAGQRGWQVLPIGPTGYGDSPYQLYSAFAGNPALISLERLRDEGLLRPEDLRDAPQSLAQADFGAAQRHRMPRLFTAFQGLRAGQGAAGLPGEFSTYCEEEREWLDDFALFAALKEEHHGAPWYSFAAPLRDRDPATLRAARERLAERVQLHRFIQWQFDRQWRALREHARHLDIELIGDMPIFVAHDSVEVWQSRGQFLLHHDGRLQVQAGVPPDYFSATGQLWGNPLYDWERMGRDGFQFWRARARRALRLFDRVRIDHFRGFCAHWEIPGDATTAIKGRWAPVPGAALFAALADELGGPSVVAARFIAEDLGIITADVDQLRESTGLPGMRVLQFSFGDGDEARARPYAYPHNLVFYTSTHDNDTLASWLRGDDVEQGGRSAAQAARERENVMEYLGLPVEAAARDDSHLALLRLALSTVADTVIIPVQDVLGLRGEARMNFPGRAAGNWGFRLLPGQLHGVVGPDQPAPSAPGDELTARLHRLTRTYGRCA